MSTSSYASMLPVLHTSTKLEHGPAEIDVQPSFMKKNYRLLTMGERFSVRLRCREHRFSWPQTRKDTPMQVSYPWVAKAAPEDTCFDAHQICTCCGVQRFYDTRTMSPGMFFVRLDAGAATERQQTPFDVRTTEEQDFLLPAVGEVCEPEFALQ